MLFTRSFTALTLFFAAALLPAQQQAASPSSNNGLLALDVVVTPGNKGAPVAGLSQSSFTVLDNGAAQPIRSFRAVSGQPAAVKVLVVLAGGLLQEVQHC